jgi:hypothetical protein
MSILIAAGLAAPGPALAQPPCWKQVVEDWSDGAISGVYPIRCYRQALHRLPEDVRLYSSASDDIGRALASLILATRPPPKAPSRRAAGLAAARDDGQTPTPLILAGSLAAVLALIGAAGFFAGRRKSQGPERKDRWTGAWS